MLLQPVLTLVLTGTALALPNAKRPRHTSECADGPGHDQPHNSNSTASITAATIEVIMPLSASCAERGSECTNSSAAAPFLAASLDTYGIASTYERAGVLALIAYESVELQYRTNQNAEQKSLGRGTANE